MSLLSKRIAFAIGLLIIWFGFVTMGPNHLVSVVMYALGGWLMGGIIYNLAERMFPDE